MDSKKLLEECCTVIDAAGELTEKAVVANQMILRAIIQDIVDHNTKFPSTSALSDELFLRKRHTLYRTIREQVQGVSRKLNKKYFNSKPVFPQEPEQTKAILLELLASKNHTPDPAFQEIYYELMQPAFDYRRIVFVFNKHREKRMWSSMATAIMMGKNPDLK